MSKQTNPARTCADCLHCQACHLWSSGAISDSVAPKCQEFEPARYVSLAEIQDLYRMYKGELVPVVRCKDCKNRGTPYSCPMRKLVIPDNGPGSYEDCTEDDGFCHMGAKRDGGAEDGEDRD